MLKTIFYTILLWLLSNNLLHAELSNAAIDSQINGLKQQQAEMDSASNAAERIHDSIMFKHDLEQQNRNLDAFVEMQRENERKEIRSLWMRGAFLGVMLIMVIASIIRNRSRAKEKAKQS